MLIMDELIASQAPETGELEFKGTLPLAPIKGQPATADRWIEKGDRVGTTLVISYWLR